MLLFGNKFLKNIVPVIYDVMGVVKVLQKFYLLFAVTRH
jgi:hypothetical protein